MTIRTRLTLWYAGVLCASVLLIGGLSYYQLVIEPRQERKASPTQPADSDEESDFSDLLQVLLWFGLPAALLGIAGGAWLTRQALKPIATLTSAAEQITDRSLHTRLPRTGNGDELDRLTDVFNAITARLDASFQRIREFTLHASH